MTMSKIKRPHSKGWGKANPKLRFLAPKSRRSGPRNVSFAIQIQIPIQVQIQIQIHIRYRSSIRDPSGFMIDS